MHQLIERLQLENFRSYDRLDLKFEHPRTLIVGENGAGKSTIPDAIALALTGRCRGVNAKGEGQRELIRTGTEQATIRLWVRGLADPIVVTLDQKKGTSRNMPVDMVLGRLRTTDSYVTAAVYGSTFFDMGHVDAKKLLMRLLNVRVQVPADPERTEGGSELIGLDEVELRYKAAFDNRAYLKRSLAAIVIPKVERRIDLEMLDADKLKIDLDMARRKYEAVVNATADVRAKSKQLAQRKVELANLTGQDIGTLETKLATHQDMLRDHEAQVATAQDALRKAEGQAVEATSTLDAQINELKLFVQRVEGHAGDNKVPAECVLGKAIPCLTPAKEFTDVIKQTKKQMADLEKRVKAGTKRAEAIAAASQSVKDADRNVTYHKGQVASLRASIEREQDGRKQLAEVTTELDALLPQLRTGEGQIEEASGDLAKLQAQDKDLATYKQALANQEKLQIEHESIGLDLKEAEAQVVLLGPNGARATALQTAVDDFHQAINAALAPFKFELAINVDPWMVRVLHPNTKGALPFELLSKGQRLWTGLAFQLALAAVSGLDFCVVDDVDGVVGRNLAVMTELILGAPVGQVLVVKAQGAQNSVPEIDGLQVVRVMEAQPELSAAAG